MRISYKGDYALKAMLDLALHHDSGLVTIHELAERADIPIKFLEQVLLELKRGGFVESRRGNVGGYLLARASSEIKLGEVVRFIEGPIEPIACVTKGYTDCRDIYKCAFKKIWQEVAEATAGIIDGVSFEDLVNQVKARENTLVYQI